VFLNLPFPLPPLAEQRRIVAKVDALMALCDRLEAALTEASSTSDRLLGALLHEALTPGAVTEMEAENTYDLVARAEELGTGYT